MSENWVIQNLENALQTWDKKLAEIWALLTQNPQNFKGGTLWNVAATIHGTLQAIGLEIAYATVDKYQGTLKSMIIGAVLAVILVFCRDGYFWGSPWGYGAAVAAGVVVVRLLSATVIGIALVKVITAALKKTGVLKGFACAK